MTSIEIKINGNSVKAFSEFNFTSDLFGREQNFDYTCSFKSIQGIKIELGDKIEGYVNNEKIFTGIIIGIEDSLSDGGETRITGTDYMGFMSKYIVEKSQDFENSSLLTIAKSLCSSVQYLKSISFEYQSGCKSLDKKSKTVKVEAGDRISEILFNAAAQRGLLFYSNPDGTMVFGKPVNSGKVEFNFLSEKNNPQSNIKTSKMSRNIAEVYSEVIILNDETKSAAVKNKRWPAKYRFPFIGVVNSEDDNTTFEQMAINHIDQMNKSLSEYSITVKGFHQSGKLYSINSVSNVVDKQQRIPISRNMVIYSRTFRYKYGSGINAGGEETDLILGELAL